MNQKDYNKISIINVKNQLKLKEKYARGNNIYVRCPFCSNTNQSNLKLNVEKDSYYCRKCGKKGFAIGLYASLNFISNKDAFKKLMVKEADMTTNLIRVRKSIKKSDEDISIVYEMFLKMLGLTKKHYNYLIKLGFSREEIINFNFKSIPQSENERIKICNKLIHGGYNLKGIPGFYINDNMKFTFKSHKGFFIPVKNNNNILGLRIHLDEQYKFDTTDIWFSSGNEFQGVEAKNNIMILNPERSSLTLYNGGKDIIIASEMLIAYKAFSTFNQITIGLPNTISKEQAYKFLNSIDIKSAKIFMDKHTMLTDPYPIYNRIIGTIKNAENNVGFVLNDKDIRNIQNNITMPIEYEKVA